MISNIIIL